MNEVFERASALLGCSGKEVLCEASFTSLSLSASCCRPLQQRRLAVTVRIKSLTAVRLVFYEMMVGWLLEHRRIEEGVCGRVAGERMSDGGVEKASGRGERV